MNVKSTTMNALQAGSLLNSATINPMNSPTSKAFAAYAGPVINDFTKSRGVFAVNNPVYWSRGLLHFDKDLIFAVSLVTKEGPAYSVIATD
ncbi:hypothetical protein D3C76_1660730 [compost metagenome]